MVSFTDMNQVPDALLESRLEEIKPLEGTEHEHYRIVKDRENGEHYLHYAYVHVDVAGQGVEEWYHQLLPLESDDVLGLIFGEQGHAYPEHWHRTFLRNGPEGLYVWFDPSAEKDEAHYEKLGHDITGLLLQYKQKGEFDEQTMRRMMEELDRLDRPDRPEEDK